jgi:hypothetical protein
MAMTTGYQHQQPMTFTPLRSAPLPQHGSRRQAIYGPQKPAVRKPDAPVLIR